MDIDGHFVYTMIVCMDEFVLNRGFKIANWSPPRLCTNNVRLIYHNEHDENTLNRNAISNWLENVINFALSREVTIEIGFFWTYFWTTPEAQVLGMTGQSPGDNRLSISKYIQFGC